MNTDKALNSQLVSAVDEMYYRILRNRHTVYTTVTCLELLTYMYVMYRDIAS